MTAKTAVATMIARPFRRLRESIEAGELAVEADEHHKEDRPEKRCIERQTGRNSTGLVVGSASRYQLATASTRTITRFAIPNPIQRRDNCRLGVAGSVGVSTVAVMCPLPDCLAR